MVAGGTSAQVVGEQTPGPLLTPPAAAQAEAVRSSHSISSFAALGRQHMTSGFGGGTSAQVAAVHTGPVVLTTPPEATQSEALRSSHSISSPAAFGRQQMPCASDGGRSPHGFGLHVPGPLSTPARAAHSATVCISHAHT